MKRIFKDNITIIAASLILVIIYIFGMVNFLNSFYRNKEYVTNIYEEKCSTTIYDESECSDLKYELDDYVLPHTPILFFYILTDDIMRTTSVFIMIFVVIVAIYPFYKDVKSGIYKNKLTREKYNVFFRKHYRNSLKALWILPIFFLTAFLITCFVTHFKFEYIVGEPELGSGEFFWTKNASVRYLWLPYFITMLFAIIYHSLYYINAAYFMFYKCKNFVINVTATYILYLISQIVIVPILTIPIGKYMKLSELSIALSDVQIWNFGLEIQHYENIIFTSIAYAVISTLCVFLLYRNKERFVISNE